MKTPNTYIDYCNLHEKVVILTELLRILLKSPGHLFITESILIIITFMTKSKTQ